MKTNQQVLASVPVAEEQKETVKTAVDHLLWLEDRYRDAAFPFHDSKFAAELRAQVDRIVAGS